MQVSNAQEELLQWYEGADGKKNSKIVHSTERCAAGIIQAIGRFVLGPNISPRDLEKCNVEIFSPAPAHEVVRFYLFYERWRLGSVERSSYSSADDGFRFDFVRFLCTYTYIYYVFFDC